MLFIRKLSQSLKAQNWTEIWIEFLLLIIGVFLGIQVSNWNQDRLDARAEALMLEWLEEDFRAIEPSLERTILRYRETVASTGEVVRPLHLPDPPEDETTFRRVLGNAAYLWTGPPSRSPRRAASVDGLPVRDHAGGGAPASGVAGGAGGA